MNQIRTVIVVGADHRITGTAPEDLPPGEHEAVITIEPKPAAGKKFTLANFPIHDEGWDDSISLRREEMYGDDGR